MKTITQAQTRIPRQVRKDGSPFKILLYVSKAYEDAAGEWWMDGIASGTKIDLQDDMMSEQATKAMQDQINSGQIPLLRSHWDDWDGVMGFLKQGRVIPGGELGVRVWLDKEMEYCKTLFRRLTGDPDKGIAPSKLGLSIGGVVPKGATSTKVIDGRSVRVVDEIRLDHVAVTSRPAYPDAWIEDVEVKDEFARPWMRDVTKSLRKERAARPAPRDDKKPEGDHVMADQPVSQPEAETDLTKAGNPPPPPPAHNPPPPPPPQQAQQQPAEWEKGLWKTPADMQEGDRVWCCGPDAQKSEDQETDMETKTDLKPLYELIASQSKQISELTKAVQGIMSAPVRKGLGPLAPKTEPTEEPETNPGDWMHELRESVAYKSASHNQQLAMLAKAATDAARKSGLVTE